MHQRVGCLLGCACASLDTPPYDVPYELGSWDYTYGRPGYARRPCQDCRAQTDVSHVRQPQILQAACTRACNNTAGRWLVATQEDVGTSLSRAAMSRLPPQGCFVYRTHWRDHDGGLGVNSLPTLCKSAVQLSAAPLVQLLQAALARSRGARKVAGCPRAWTGD